VLTEHTLELGKSAAQLVSYCIGGVAAIGALLTYRSNSQRERAKWAVQLYDKFYEADHYKVMRDKLDYSSGASEIKQLVDEESSAFTDYLNFFELVTFLAETKQLSKSDVLRLFQYYLRCLKQHTAVMDYLNDSGKGFEQLSRFLNGTKL
jgi:uncharacterized protein YdiU (UPF0061 family)